MPTSKLIANHITTINNELDKAKQEKYKNLKKTLNINQRSRFRDFLKKKKIDETIKTHTEKYEFILLL